MPSKAAASALSPLVATRAFCRAFCFTSRNVLMPSFLRSPSRNPSGRDDFFLRLDGRTRFAMIVSRIFNLGACSFQCTGCQIKKHGDNEKKEIISSHNGTHEDFASGFRLPNYEITHLPNSPSCCLHHTRSL